MNFDTKLFIDPLLLPLSKDQEFSDQASDLFQNHFSQLFRLMTHSQSKDDASWNAAAKLLRFPEIRFTCLGYGKSSTKGSSFGKKKEDLILSIASHVAEVGIKDPYILPLYSLLEKDVGPDLISDMTTNVILPAICSYTKRVCTHFKIPTEGHKLKGSEYSLPTNLFDPTHGPVLLVPNDVLKELPVASSWDEAMKIAAQNSHLRDQLNERLGEIFRDTALTEAEKTKARIALIGSSDAFELFAEFLKDKSNKAYNFDADPGGLMILQRLVGVLPSTIPLQEKFPETITDDNITNAVDVVISQFKHLVEKKGYWKELWDGKKPRRESASQCLFFATAFAYIEALGIDLSPEPDMGLGFIDFKASHGTKKVIIEVKRSNNPKIVSGLENQLVTYCEAEKARVGYYLVVDYGNDDSDNNWHSQLVLEANRLRNKTKLDLRIVAVDAKPQLSPSKR
ncbi:MAG: hypothetical protein AAF292_12245 [Pseudomonadota bacterium]